MALRDGLYNSPGRQYSHSINQDQGRFSYLTDGTPVWIDDNGTVTPMTPTEAGTYGADVPQPGPPPAPSIMEELYGTPPEQPAPFIPTDPADKILNQDGGGDGSQSFDGRAELIELFRPRTGSAVLLGRPGFGEHRVVGGLRVHGGASAERDALPR